PRPRRNAMYRIAFTSLCLAVVSLTGCASVQVQRDKAAAVQSVAIIGFTGVTQLEDKNAPKTGVGNIVNAVNDSKDLFGGDLDKRRIAEAESAYSLLEKQLETSVGWKVKDRATLAADPAYKSALAENPN